MRARRLHACVCVYILKFTLEIFVYASNSSRGASASRLWHYIAWGGRLTSRASFVTFAHKITTSHICRGRGTHKPLQAVEYILLVPPNECVPQDVPLRTRACPGVVVMGTVSKLNFWLYCSHLWPAPFTVFLGPGGKPEILAKKLTPKRRSFIWIKERS